MDIINIIERDEKMKLRITPLILALLISVFIIGCASAEKNETITDKSIKTHANSISHGTAQIACTILELKEVNGQSICITMIDTVFGYGAGTRPIAANTELELSIEKSLDKKILKKDSKHRLTLRYTKERFGGAVDYPWQIVKLNDK